MAIFSQCLRCKLDNVLPVGGSYKGPSASVYMTSAIARLFGPSLLKICVLCNSNYDPLTLIADVISGCPLSQGGFPIRRQRPHRRQEGRGDGDATHQQVPAPRHHASGRGGGGGPKPKPEKDQRSQDVQANGVCKQGRIWKLAKKRADITEFINLNAQFIPSPCFFPAAVRS